MEITVTLKKYTILAAFLLPALIGSAQNYNNIEFIENKGQWDARVKYMGDVYAGAFYIREGGFSVLQHNRQDYEVVQDFLHEHRPNDNAKATHSSDRTTVLRSHVYAVDFVGASKTAKLMADKPTSSYNNYFIGNDPAKWAGNCRIFQAVTMENVYDNVDVRYYTDNGTLKYDIICRPGADISRIAMKYSGADKLQVKNKELSIGTSIGELKESSPFTYQTGMKGRKQVACKYVIRDNVVRFQVDDYDPEATLVIDPAVVFCSFSGSSAYNWGFTATYGPDGSFYGGGIVFSNGGSFSVTPGAYQTVFQGGSSEAPGAIDIGIVKLSPNGASRIYGTYIGGSGNEQPHSLIVDQQGQLVLAGRTNSSNYPIANGAAFPGGGSYDIVVTKLNASGSALIGSKKIGGSSMDGVNIVPTRNGQTSLQRNYGDDGRSEVIIDGANNIYVASSTQSADFYGTAGSFQPAFGGGTQDGVVLKLAPDVSSLTFASYLGGQRNDAAYVLSLSPVTGDIFVAGGTESRNFPGNHAGTVGLDTARQIDGFVAQISNNGSAIIRSSYIGTAGIDQVYGVQFDRNGFLYLMGTTTGDWPVINAAYSNPGSKQFICKLQPDMSAYVYSTVFGSSAPIPNISPTAFLVDRCENVYVSGWGGDIFGNREYPSAGTLGLPITPDANKASTDDHDFYFFVLKRDAASQLYGSYFGQNGGFPDHVDGGTSRFDANGVIYQAACANCNGGVQFPTTIGVVAPNNNATPGCSLAMFKVAFNLAGVGSEVQSAIGGVPRDTAGCLPLQVVFTDLVRNAEEYIWDFGDGTVVGPLPAATGYSQPHTYNAVGTYRVMLIAINPNSCNVRDTSYVHIRVGDLKANLNASFVKLEPCDSFKYRFDNTSFTDPTRPFTDTSFLWRFDDGTPPIIAGMNSITHSFATPGDYTIWLVLRDTAYCNYPDSLRITVSVSDNVKAAFTTPPIGCAPYTAVFDNGTVGGQDYEWDFGDPASGASNTSTAFEPTHLYAVPGTYHIRMVANNANTCNKTDTAEFDIVVYEKPLADFSYTPVTPVENTPNVFTNLASANATRFKWLFGDGDSLVTTLRADVTHQYNSTGKFNACLIAYNEVGCTDTLCREVSTIIVPVLDVPNAFTPNQPGINSVVYVRGFGIAKMRFVIWNRWGQKVFETNNRLQGWDGKVKGVVQPMDVYAYTLDVEFFDGTKTTRKGDITLIR